MTRVHKALLICGIASFGLWGCGKGGPAPTADNRHLEAKVAKLEEDLKATTAARDTYRTKLAATEDKLRAAGLEADRLGAALKATTGDRDQLRDQFAAFRTQIRDLLGKTETAMGATATVTPVSVQKAAGATTGS